MSRSQQALHTTTERRRDTRLGISIDMTIRRMTAGGTVLQEERTVTDNIGRHGARVLTAISTLGVNDSIWLQEVGGDFQAWSTVRHVSTGKDNVRRLGIEFLDRTAPDRLVAVESLTTPRPSGAMPSGATSATLDPPPVAALRKPPSEERRMDPRFDVNVEVWLRGLGLAPRHTVLWEERTVADNIGRRGARVKTSKPGLAEGDLVSLHEVGGDFQVRGAVRNVVSGKDGVRRLGLVFLDGFAPFRLLPVGVSRPQPQRPPAAAAQYSPPRQKPPLPEEIREAQRLCRVGQRLLADGRYWDTIQTLGPALHFAQGTETNRRLRTLVARSLAANPDWLRRAEQILLGMVQDDPRHADACVALAVLYKVAGLKSRARSMVSKALEANPNHSQALAERRSLQSEGQ